MVDKNTLITAILSLYDENTQLMRKVGSLKEKKHDGITTLLLEKGQKALAYELIGSWEFRYHAPSILTGSGSVKPFEVWMMDITTEIFPKDLLINYMNNADVTFPDILGAITPGLKEYYDKEVSTRQESLSHETV